MLLTRLEVTLGLDTLVLAATEADSATGTGNPASVEAGGAAEVPAKHGAVTPAGDESTSRTGVAENADVVASNVAFVAYWT